MRIITFSDFRSPTNHLFVKHKILKVREVIKLYQLKLVFDFLNNSLPSDLQHLFTLSSEVHNYQLRRKFHLPRISASSYGILSIKYRCPVLWNKTFQQGIAMDKHVDNNVSDDHILNIQQFKRLLKKHFLSTYTL